jgi:hypothetical protein
MKPKNRKESIRSQIAVFNYDGARWVVVRGINGTEVLGRFTNQRDAQALCEQHNVALAKTTSHFLATFLGSPAEIIVTRDSQAAKEYAENNAYKIRPIDGKESLIRSIFGTKVVEVACALLVLVSVSACQPKAPAGGEVTYALPDSPTYNPKPFEI